MDAENVSMQVGYNSSQDQKILKHKINKKSNKIGNTNIRTKIHTNDSSTRMKTMSRDQTYIDNINNNISKKSCIA